MSTGKTTGKCKWFDRKKGYGFIETDQEKDVFVHQTAIQVDGFRALYPDQEVEFRITQTGPNSRLCAVDVTAVGGGQLTPQSGRGRGGRGGRGRGRGGRGGRGGDAAAPRPPMNKAFVFIKPHAMTDDVKNLVTTTFKARGIKILKEGPIASEKIDSEKLIDHHYGAIAAKATLLKPKDLNVPTDKFQKKFGLSWADALKSGRVFNAMDGCKELGVDAAALDSLWAGAKKAGTLEKFGGGFYCAKLEVKGKKPCYVFNGFYMSMRSKFTKPGESIHFYIVEFPPSKLSWADFREKVLGGTDPATADPDSLRAKVLRDYKTLGLKAEPNVGDNSVHASASPFEGLSERMNWLGQKEAGRDTFGKLLIADGITEETIKHWCTDPQVTLLDGSKGSLFDAVEDTDAADCVAKLVELNKKNQTSA